MRVGKRCTTRYIRLDYLDTYGNPGHYKHDPGKVGEPADNVTEGERGKEREGEGRRKRDKERVSVRGRERGGEGGRERNGKERGRGRREGKKGRKKERERGCTSEQRRDK